MSDEELRTALRELADLPAPADLAGRALLRARRDRRRTLIATTVATVLAVGAVLVGPATLRHRTETLAAAPAPAWIPAYRTAGLASVPDRASPDFVYDGAGYRPTAPGTLVTPSPDGRLALVMRGDITGYAVVPLARATVARDVDLLPALAGRTWTWSPDSRRLLAGDTGRRATTATVVDAGTGTRTTVELDLGALGGRDHEVGWRPGSGFAVWSTDPPPGRTAPGPGPGELRLLDGAGRLTRSYPVPQVDHVELSPGGTRALLTTYDLDRGGGGRSWLLDLATGTVTGTAARGDEWYDEDQLVRIEVRTSSAGEVTGGGPVVVVDAESGEVVRRSALAAPAGSFLAAVWLVRGGPVPAGATVV